MVVLVHTEGTENTEVWNKELRIKVSIHPISKIYNNVETESPTGVSHGIYPVVKCSGKLL
jgi:hypothetical protein